jgi:hypothetical protein
MPPSPLTNQPACKPGSVWRKADALRVTAIPLQRRLPGASSNLPGRQDSDTYLERAASRRCAPRRPYSVLLPVGFAMPPALPPARCALTAPFHPCRGDAARAARRGGLFSVALSLGSPPPDVIRHRMSMEPGLSSPATFRPLPERPSSRLTHQQWGAKGAPSRAGTGRRMG